MLIAAGRVSVLAVTAAALFPGKDHTGYAKENCYRHKGCQVDIQQYAAVFGADPELDVIALFPAPLTLFFFFLLAAGLVLPVLVYAHC